MLVYLTKYTRDVRCMHLSKFRNNRYRCGYRTVEIIIINNPAPYPLTRDRIGVAVFVDIVNSTTLESSTLKLCTRMLNATCGAFE